MNSKKRSVVKVIKHPSWHGQGTGSDIALIKLRDKVTFKKNSILPICFPFPAISKKIFNKRVYVAGNRFVHCLICMIIVYTEGSHIMQFLGLKKNALNKILVYGTVIISQVVQIPPLTRKLTEKCVSGNHISGGPPVYNQLGELMRTSKGLHGDFMGFLSLNFKKFISNQYLIMFKVGEKEEIRLVIKIITHVPQTLDQMYMLGVDFHGKL